MYIVSNSAEKRYIEAFLNSSDTRKYFKDYIAASSLNISKSAAITKVVNEYGLEKAVYIGDTILDLEAANESKIPFIQAKYGFGNDLNTKYYINKISELPELLENLDF